MTGNAQEAARYFGVHVTTVRRWIRVGCPCLLAGSAGRTHGARLDFEAVSRWRIEQCVPALAAHQADELLSILETALMQSLKCDDLARRIKTTEAQAGLAVVIIFRRLYLNLKERWPEPHELPENMKRVCSVLVEAIKTGTFQKS